MAPENGTILNLLTNAPWRAHAFLFRSFIHSQEFTAESADPSRRFVREDVPGPADPVSSRGRAQCHNAQEWVEESPREVDHLRDAKWTESVAVGNESFVTATKENLGIKAKGREVIGVNAGHELREPPAPYKGILGHKNAGLRPQNEYFWDDTPFIST